MLSPLAQAGAESFLPTDDSTIVERLRDRPLDRTDQELRKARAQLKLSPQDLALAVDVARRCIQVARRDGDPRYLGYAQAALASWWSTPNPPMPVLLMKATILQSSHEFDLALAALARVLHAQPGNAQAWLTQATILQVQGKFEEAQASCERLRPLGAGLYADACLAEQASLTGRATEARATLDRLSAAASSEKANMNAGWLAIIQAELTERMGDFAAAERFYRVALADSNDAYTKGAFADFLLDRHRAAEVIALLKGEQRSDPLLLRLALAYRAEQHDELPKTVAALRSRFEAAHLRGDTVHRREEARFELTLLQRPDEALRLALENWAVQKEPADVRILLEAARAAGRDADAEAVRAFIRNHQLADQRLAALTR
ncbi:MAG: hypothetical protein ABI771_08295 [Betaproteobacteria bacterium]